MTLKCWNATSPLKVPSVDTSTSVESLLAATNGPHDQDHGSHGRPSPIARCRSQSSNWDKDGVDKPSDGETDCFDATAATIAAPSHHIHAMPALWVNGRRRLNRSRIRRRTNSENTNPSIHSTLLLDSSMSALSSMLPSSLSSGEAQLRETAAAVGNLNQRLRILTPDGPRFAGWVRGQAAEVRWEVLDPSVQCVRIDVCNVAWTVPTTIAHCVVNDGTFRWRRVYWGMPIAEGYYVNIYDVTEQKDSKDMTLLAQSERFAVIK